jgi:hypothetical protein
MDKTKKFAMLKSLIEWHQLYLLMLVLGLYLQEFIKLSY